jgi:hypothetical protein
MGGTEVMQVPEKRGASAKLQEVHGIVVLKRPPPFGAPALRVRHSCKSLLHTPPDLTAGKRGPISSALVQQP